LGFPSHLSHLSYEDPSKSCHLVPASNQRGGIRVASGHYGRVAACPGRHREPALAAARVRSVRIWRWQAATGVADQREMARSGVEERGRAAPGLQPLDRTGTSGLPGAARLPVSGAVRGRHRREPGAS